MPDLIHIVDPDAALRVAAGRVVGRRGHASAGYAGGAEFLAARLEPGCVLLDLDMEGMSGHDVQREIARRGALLAVVAMSGRDDLELAVEAMKLGAVEFLRKPLDEEALLGAVERALLRLRAEEGRRRSRTSAAARVARLSRRERQVLEGLVAGLSNKAMARVLGLSPRTIEMHRANMMAELGLASLPDALRLALDCGVAPLARDGSGGEPAPGPAGPEDGLEAAAAAPPEREEVLRLVLEASSDGAWDWDLRSGQIRLSTALIDRLGYVPEAVPGRLENYECLLHPSDRAGFRAALEAHLAGETAAYACTYRIRTRSGEWRWTDVRGRVVERDPVGGKPRRMIGTANDITRQREGEEKARESSALVALVQSGVGAGIWNLDVETRRVELCERSRAFHDLPLEEELDFDRWAERVEPADLPPVLDALERAIASGGSFRAEFRVRGSDGHRRWILSHGQLVVGEGGNRRLVGLNQDVTAEREAG